MNQLVTSRLTADSKLPKGFGKYKRETPHPVRRLKIRENPVLAELKEAWRRFEYIIDDADIRQNYKKACEAIKRIRYSARDVENFSIAIAEFQEEEDFFYSKAGLFLSALINSGTDEDYVLQIAHLEKELCDLGYKNIKNIVIKGSVKLNTCQLMERGTVTIEGNCDAQSMFCMKGGTIVINGNLNASECCERMTGGAIIVKGDLIGEMEDGMYGGELHVYGDYTDKEVRTIGKWKFYHKGVLVTGKEE